MVAYAVQEQFIGPIQMLVKRHTLRNERKRHARPGEEIQIYFAMRTRQCRLIGRAICTAVTPIHIAFYPPKVAIYGRAVIDTPSKLSDFARSDGFASWRELKEFWDKNHARPKSWFGMIIEWKDFQPAPKGTKP